LDKNKKNKIIKGMYLKKINLRIRNWVMISTMKLYVEFSINGMEEYIAVFVWL